MRVFTGLMIAAVIGPAVFLLEDTGRAFIDWRDARVRIICNTFY